MKLKDILDRLYPLCDIKLIVSVYDVVADECTKMEDIKLYSDCDVLQIDANDNVLVVRVADVYDE